MFPHQKKSDLVEEFRSAINRLGMEKYANIPDFIMAELAVSVLELVCKSVHSRDKFFNGDVLRRLTQGFPPGFRPNVNDVDGKDGE